jgi:hypothetical protein
MSWNPAKVLEISEGITASFQQNNLAGDGEGRFAFAHGGRIQCTKRHGTAQSCNDFTLAMKAADVEVMQVFWWRDVPKYSRPLLVFVTDAPVSGEGKACLQIWDTRSGKGTRMFNINLDSEDSTTVQFGRGIGSITLADSSTFLFVGLSTGEVGGFCMNKKGLLERTCTLKGCTSAVTAVGGDKMLSSLIAASDESGNLIVWAYRGQSWEVVYRYRDKDEDYCCSLGIRGRLAIAGHSSGKVTFHDVEESQKLAETVTNSKGITSIDVHPTRDIFLVTGEDCRASILALPTMDGDALQIILSICLNGVITGGCFTNSKPNVPDITLLLWERSHLIQYEFAESQLTP